MIRNHKESVFLFLEYLKCLQVKLTEKCPNSSDFAFSENTKERNYLNH